MNAAMLFDENEWPNEPDKTVMLETLAWIAAFTPRNDVPLNFQEGDLKAWGALLAK